MTIWHLNAIAAVGLVVGLIVSFDHRDHQAQATYGLPACALSAPEDVVVYRSSVPGPWDSCAPADDLVSDQSWREYR